MSSFLERLGKSTLNRLIKKGIDKVVDSIFRKKEVPSEATPKQPSSSSQPPASEIKKTHPWRLCAIGEHWVVEHDLTVPPSAKGPGYQTLRRGHCRNNPGKQEFYTAQELREIASLHFEELRSDPDVMPVPDALDFPNGNGYDLSIAGWTKFWNETLKPDNPVTADFIKALISTESGFEIPRDVQSKMGPARGLIQITESTRVILQDPEGELRDHLVSLTPEESRQTEPNIAAGVRWLYHKRHLLERRLKRKVSWEEAGAEYKGIFNDIGKDEKTDDIMQKMKTRHKRLKSQRKKIKKAKK